MPFSAPTPDAFLFDPLSLAYGQRKGQIQGRQEGFLDGRSAGYKDGYNQGWDDAIAVGDENIDEAQGFINNLHKEKLALQQQVAKLQTAIKEMQKALETSSSHILAVRAHVKKLEEKISAQKKEAIHSAEKYAHLQQLYKSVCPPQQFSQFLSQEPLPVFDECKSASMSLHKSADSKSAPNNLGLLSANSKALLEQGIVNASLVEATSDQSELKTGAFIDAPSLSQSVRGRAVGEVLKKPLPPEEELSSPGVSEALVLKECPAQGQNFVANLSKDRRKELKKIGKAAVEENSAKLREKLEKKWWQLGF